MEIRNVKYAENDGYLECEYNHEEFGWIPYTAYKEDIEKLGCDIYQECISGNYEIEAYVPVEPTYQELRQAEYPSLEEQEDMRYWDLVNGTTIWVDTITAIKEKYPKPEEA